MAKKQLVVFQIGKEQFAMDISLAKEVVPLADLTPIPDAPEFVGGLMNLRGALVPVLDLRKRLRAGSWTSPEPRIIVANLDGVLTGLIVDGACEVRGVEEREIEPPPDVIREVGADYVAGIIHLPDKAITLIDIGRAFEAEITAKLDEVIKLIRENDAH
jgi:purine-binding chemotaxis protein CheW